MKKLCIFICLVGFCLLVGKGLYWARRGFNICKIRPPLHTQLEVWNEEAEAALGQTYYFLGRGRQCFAFESEDQKYVLKLPRTNIYKLPHLSHFFPSLYTAEKIGRMERESFIVNSFKIAYEELKEQTGTVALHFGTFEEKQKRVKIVDAIGCSYLLPLERRAFVLQYKQPVLMKAFLESLQKGERKEAEKILTALIDVVVDRGQKGIWNRDESFLRNYGYDGEKAYQIDIGSFYHKEDGVASIRDTMHPVISWLKELDPAMAFYFEEQLDLALKKK